MLCYFYKNCTECDPLVSVAIQEGQDITEDGQMDRWAGKQVARAGNAWRQGMVAKLWIDEGAQM